MKNNIYCDKILGEGMMGEVYISGVNESEEIEIGTKKITFPVVAKRAKDKGKFDMEIIENKLYIYTFKNLTTEALILSYTNKLWYDKKSPHLPLMIGYSMCDKDNEMSVNRIVTERHGIDEKIKIQHNYQLCKPLLKGIKVSEFLEKDFSTLYDLLEYINLNNDGTDVILPNNITCNMIELYDYIIISYLHTHKLLLSNNIIIGDMHPGNIFIHWLNDNSYLGDQNIGNIKNIVYKFDDKYIKIETFGFIIKVGDLGMTVIKPKDDVYIVGQAVNLKENMKIFKKFIEPNFIYNISFLTKLQKYMSPKFMRHTVLQSILNDEPYVSLTTEFPITVEQTSRLPTIEQIIDKFTKYFIDKKDIREIQNVLLVE
jgi:hypothetical protein